MNTHAHATKQQNGDTTDEQKALFYYRVPLSFIVLALCTESLFTYQLISAPNILLISLLTMLGLSYAIEPFFFRRLDLKIPQLHFILLVFDLFVVINVVLLTYRRFPSLVVLFHVHILLSSLLLTWIQLKRMFVLSSIAFILVFFLINSSHHQIVWPILWQRLPVALIQMFTLILVGYLGAHLVRRIQTTRQESKEVTAHLERVELNHDAILNALPSGVMGFDHTQHLTMLNPAALDLLQDFEPDNWLGLHIDAIRMTLGPVFLPIQQDKENYLFEVALHSQSGERWFAGRHRMISNAAGTIIIFQDVTQARELRRRVQIEEHVERMGRIAANMAHEIRNPLAGLMGSIELLSSSFSAPESTKEQRLLKIISRESARINRLVTDFLKYAQVRPPQLKYHQVNELLSDLMATHSTSLSSSIRLNFICPPNVKIYTDRDFLEQIMWNLINNAKDAALEHHSNAQIDIVVQDQSDSINIEIHDNGPGFDENILHKIQEPFYTTKVSGNGLGLAIVDTLIRRLGGAVSFNNSQRLPGACVSLSFDNHNQLFTESSEIVHSVNQAGELLS